jgi:hypothetical protein
MQAARDGAALRPIHAQSAPAEPAAPRPPEARDPHYRPGREGMTNVTGYFPPAVKKQLRRISVEEDTTIQELLAEALNDIFAKRGMPEIAPREDPTEVRGGRRARTKSGDRMEVRA